MSEGEELALWTYRFDAGALPPVPLWPKVACPICGKKCGGRGVTKTEGVHAHMKFKHGIKQKWKR